jgi:choice-of-anchor A domain-containing protein
VDNKSVSIYWKKLLFVAAALPVLFSSPEARAEYCSPKSTNSTSSLQCFAAQSCNAPGTHCYVPIPLGCPTGVKVLTTCNPTPSDFQVTLWDNINYTGSCITFEIPPTMGALSVPRLDVWGFDDCIDSLKVGAKLRLHAYRDVEQGSGGPFYHGSANSSTPVYWQATYEPGPQSETGTYHVNSSMSSLVIENRTLLQNQEPIPFQYRYDYPNNKNTAWSVEAQGLCHNQDNWFITKETFLPTEWGQAVLDAKTPCPPPQVRMSYFCADPNHIDPEYTCVLSTRYTGRIFRWPLETDLWQSNPTGVIHRDLWEFNVRLSPLGDPIPSTKLGYRHFGDPDRMKIQGTDYIFIPVEKCENAAPAIILVLDSNLDYVATWVVPPPDGSPEQDGHLGWVAVRPGTETEPEVWVARQDIKNGNGLRKLKGQLANGRPVDGITLTPAGELPVTNFQGAPLSIKSVSGGVFSPTGKTLYLVHGETPTYCESHYGGIHVIDPLSGQTLANSSSQDDAVCYGPFCYGSNVTYCGDEPEGMDFFDTRCTDKVIPNISVEKESQLHVFLLNNNEFFDDDNIRVKHYSVNGISDKDNESGETGLPFMCDPGVTPPPLGNASAWKLGTIGTTGQGYPSDFNVFTFGSVGGIQHAQGPIAAGGAVFLSSFSINSVLLPVGVVSGGLLMANNGRIPGKIYYGGALGISNTVTCDGACTSNEISGRPIDFASARAALQAMSRGLRARTTTGTTQLAYGSTLTLRGSNPNINTFMVSAFDLAHTYSVSIIAPATSMVVVNVSGQDVSFANAGFSTSGLDLHKVIWNFYEAKKLKVSSVGFGGSILAPYADVTLEWGSLDGTIVASSLSSTSELHYFPFRYDLLARL